METRRGVTASKAAPLPGRRTGSQDRHRELLKGLAILLVVLVHALQADKHCFDSEP